MIILIYRTSRSAAVRDYHYVILGVEGYGIKVILFTSVVGGQLRERNYITDSFTSETNDNLNNK